MAESRRLSNSTLAGLAFLVVSSFDTVARKLFEMKYRDTVYVLSEEDLLISEPFRGKKPPILSSDCHGEWDWRRYDITSDNILQKRYIELMRDAYQTDE